MSNNAHDLSNRLLKALDDNYNVVDMRTVNEIISILEKINITKELLETTRLGKHVNELRRKTSDQTLARRAKVLVKRWRDLVIPNVASPGHTGSNRSSSERQVRRLGGTPLTSPALSRQVVSPAVPSPRPPSRPAWGGYESDSQDVILVDDEPTSATAAPPPAAPPPAPPAPPAPLANTHKPHTPTTKRPLSPASHHDERKAKRDKKPKRRRGHSRAGDGAEASASVTPTCGVTASATPHAAAVATGTAWAARNGTPHGERRKNGCRSDTLDPYAALVKRMPPAGVKKVKTTKELLEQIQSRGGRTAASPHSPRSPASPDVMLIEPDPCPLKVESPLRNGSSEPAVASPTPVPPPPPPLEDEREYAECTCGELADERCPAAARRRVLPGHVRALHHALLPGVNGTRAPPHPHQYAVRKPTDPERPDLFYSIVPLYKYSDYADDYCVKNMSRVPLSTHLPWTEFAPSPAPPPPPPSPPPLRPYPIDSIETKHERDPSEPDEDLNVEDDCSPSVLDDRPPDEVVEEKREYERPEIGPEMVGVPNLEASERLKAPLLSAEDESQFDDKKVKVEIEEKLQVADEFKSEQQEHRTVERTKEEREATDGRTLYALCERARSTIPYSYSQTAAAPVLTLPDDEAEVVPALETALAQAEAHTERDEFGRPARAHAFTEWHECARLGDLLALPYVVID